MCIVISFLASNSASILFHSRGIPSEHCSRIGMDGQQFPHFPPNNPIYQYDKGGTSILQKKKSQFPTPICIIKKVS